MSCLNPYFALPIGLTENGKPKYRLFPHKGINVDLFRSYGMENFDYVLIPCGKCKECRLSYSRDWRTRLVLEACSDYDNVFTPSGASFFKKPYNNKSIYFITLTYNNDHLPLVDGVPSLDKYAISWFMKHLRERFSDCTLRYYGTAEYGSHTLRPHYHLIVFGLPKLDLAYKRSSSLGNMLYENALVNNAWSIHHNATKSSPSWWESLGDVLISVATAETFGYTARYTSKKSDENLSFYVNSHNLVAPFSSMSNSPGLGFGFMLENMFSILKNVKSFVPFGGDSFEFMPPRYFYRLSEKYMPMETAERKAQNNAFAKLSFHDHFLSGSLGYEETLMKDVIFSDARVKKLVRNDM